MTVVRFRKDALRHCKAGRQFPWGGEYLRGQPVTICLPPVMPDGGWNCDTERVWRIPDSEIARLTGHAPTTPIYACEHQLDLD